MIFPASFYDEENYVLKQSPLSLIPTTPASINFSALAIVLNSQLAAATV